MDRAELIRLLNVPSAAGEPRDVVVCAQDPRAFIESFGQAVAAGGNVFLADPAWGETERAQFAAIRARGKNGTRRNGEPMSEEGWLCIPTGGSSGAIKLARHDESTLATAVRGFSEFFEVKRVNAVGLLPLHHVSGLMAWMRCVMSGGEYVAWSWRELEAGGRPRLPEGDVFLSLVPTQLDRLLRQPEAIDWMHRFRAVFIGGGPAWPELVERGAAADLPLAFSYGMTETAAMVTALKPEDFLSGVRGSGHPLPHARVEVDDDGRITIDAASLFRGYWPGTRASGAWSPGDLGAFDAAGSLHIRGRADALIISGGEKIDPAEVEAALRATGRFSDIAVLGLPDAEWGARVVALHPAADGAVEAGDVESHLDGKLARYKWPKAYVPVTEWPRNAQGKLMRERLRDQVGSAVPSRPGFGPSTGSGT